MPLHYAHVKVFGKVQGVFFRKHTVRRAEASSVPLLGTVRNLEDGRTVEIFAFCAEQAPLREFCEWCTATGSPKSVIESFEVSTGLLSDLDANMQELLRVHYRPFAQLK